MPRDFVIRTERPTLAIVLLYRIFLRKSVTRVLIGIVSYS
jgi:hypothetical protein